MGRSYTIIALMIFIFLGCFNNRVISDSGRDSYNQRLHALTLLCQITVNTTVSFQNNLYLLLSDFTLKSSLLSFYNSSSGDDRESVYGYYMCRGDVTQKVCSSCIKNGTEFVMKSSCGYKDGYFSSEKCNFGFSNHSMYGLLDNMTSYSYDFIQGNVSNKKDFNNTLSSTLKTVINEAAFGNGTTDGEKFVQGFATSEGTVTGDEIIYTMAQCTPDIVGVNCSKCLSSASSVLLQGDGRPGGHVDMPKCQLRYDNVSFYDFDGSKTSFGIGLRPHSIGVYSVVILVMFYSFSMFY